MCAARMKKNQTFYIINKGKSKHNWNPNTCPIVRRPRAATGNDWLTDLMDGALFDVHCTADRHQNRFDRSTTVQTEILNLNTWSSMCISQAREGSCMLMHGPGEDYWPILFCIRRYILLFSICRLVDDLSTLHRSSDRAHQCRLLTSCRSIISARIMQCNGKQSMSSDLQTIAAPTTFPGSSNSIQTTKQIILCK